MTHLTARLLIALALTACAPAAPRPPEAALHAPPAAPDSAIAPAQPAGQIVSAGGGPIPFFARPGGAHGALIAYDSVGGHELFRLPPGLLSADELSFVSVAVSQHESVASLFAATTGQALAELHLPGTWKLGGLSPDGGTAILESGDAAPGQTSFVLVDIAAGVVNHQLTLEGDFDAEAVSADGRSLFLVEHRRGADAGTYVIRAYDLAGQGLLADPVRSKTSDEVMAGYAWHGLGSPDGRWLLTLYLNTRRNAAFVHALNLVDKFPVCIDLPSGAGDMQALEHYSLALSTDGSRLYAANAALGVLAEIDLGRYQVVRITRFDGIGAPGGVRLARSLGAAEQAAPLSRLSMDGARLHFADGDRLWSYDLGTGVLAGPRVFDAPITGVGVSPDSGRLWVATRDGLVRAVEP